MRIKRGLEISIIEHPMYPEVKVHIRRLSRLEIMDYYSRVESASSVPIPLKDGADYVYKDDGDVQVVFKQTFDMALVFDMLSKSVTKWEGIEDENGDLVEYNKDVLDVLFDPALDVVREDKLVSFWAYILERIKENTLGAESNVALDSK